MAKVISQIPPIEAVLSVIRSVQLSEESERTKVDHSDHCDRYSAKEQIFR